MNSLTQEIAANASVLSEQDQKLALDFIKSLQTKLAHQQVSNSNVALTDAPQTEGAKMLHIMEDYGLLGCMEGDEQLSIATLSESALGMDWNREEEDKAWSKFQ